MKNKTSSPQQSGGKDTKNVRKNVADNKSKKPSAEKKRPKLPNIKYLGGLLFAKMVRGGTSSMRSNAEQVNQLNVFPVPDGDTGDNMRLTIESGIRAIENLDTDDLAYVMKLFSHGMLLGARGNSGVILSQLFAGMAKGLQTEPQADAEALAHAMQLGVEQAYTSVMTPTEGTILTVAREAVAYAIDRLTPKSTIRSFFSDLVKEMQASLDRTPEILQVLKEAGVVDSGGAGLFYIMDGFNRVLNGEEPTDTEPLPAPMSAEGADIGSFGPDSVMTYGYCTEFLLQLQNSKTDPDAFDIEAWKAYLGKHGDSIVAFQTGSIVKVHIHTMHPERIMAVARRYGEFLTVKIENMSVQHTESHDAQEKPPRAASTATAVPKKPIGVVAVACGEGITALLREFGADAVIEGGQTHNPSTGDLLTAYEEVGAEHIFVLPNNSNILMAAEQSAEICEGATIHVIPTKSIAAGYAALSSADLSASVEEIESIMHEAIGRIATGYISPAVRDADMNGVHILCGDTIGIVDKTIVASMSDRLEICKCLVEQLLSSERFLFTVFCGKEASEEEQAAIGAYVAECHPEVELYFIDGGQEVYPYIFLAE